MRILFLGDIVGDPGVEIVCKAVPILRQSEKLDFVIANAENATAGSGLKPGTYRQLRSAGIDAFTMGDHIYKRAEIIPLMEKEPICKPANYPDEAPGQEVVIVSTADGPSLAVFSLLGRTFMRPVDCPFQAADRVLDFLQGKTSCILVDVHAEATADKYLLAHYLKGRVSAVLGTHTHVQTADEQLLPPGTAFISDVGMTGPYDSILGRRIDRVLFTTRTFIPSAFDVATGDPRLAGVVVETTLGEGHAISIRRLMLDDREISELRLKQEA